MIHTTESLTALKRNALIQTAIKTGACTPSAAHSSKSVKLIEAILAKQTAETAPLATAVEEAPAAVEAPIETVATEVTAAEPAPAPVAGDVIDTAPASNVEEFPTQTEIPVEPKPETASNGIFKISRKVFQRQLAAVSKLPGKGTMPILNCALIQFGSGRVAVEATNLDCNVRTEAPAETDGTFSVAVPFTILTKFVAKCTSDFLMAEARGGSLFISDIENKTEIMGIPVSEWPEAPQHADVVVMHVAGRELAKVFTESLPCASEDETRYILNGVFLDTRSTPTMVATDGRRIVTVPIVVEKSVTPFNGIIPTFFAEVVRSSIPQDASALIARSESFRGLSIRTELNGFSYRAVGRLVDGNYPNYAQVIPKDTAERTTFELNTADLIAALARVLVVVNSGEKTPAVVFKFSKDLVEISAANTSVGNGREKITAQGGADEFALRVGLNGEFVREIIAAWSEDRVTLSVREETFPLVITGGGKTAVVMPVRLS